MIMYYFGKSHKAFAVPNQEATTVVEVLVNDLISRFDVPLELHLDQRRNFETAAFQKTSTLLEIRKTTTTP